MAGLLEKLESTGFLLEYKLVLFGMLYILVKKSLAFQSLEDEDLVLLNRDHTSLQAVRYMVFMVVCYSNAIVYCENRCNILL